MKRPSRTRFGAQLGVPIQYRCLSAAEASALRKWPVHPPSSPRGVHLAELPCPNSFSNQQTTATETGFSGSLDSPIPLITAQSTWRTRQIGNRYLYASLPTQGPDGLSHRPCTLLRVALRPPPQSRGFAASRLAALRGRSRPCTSHRPASQVPSRILF